MYSDLPFEFEKQMIILFPAIPLGIDNIEL
jgi:hypothetical protein